MDWLSSMQNAIYYMEDNILNSIDYDQIAQSAYSSKTMVISRKYGTIHL